MTGTGKKVAVVGGGAIGGLLAAAAEAAGHDVTLCVRTPFPHLEVQADGKLRKVRARIATEAGAEDVADWVILATKAQDTKSAAPWLLRLCGPGTTVVVAQNGIEHEERVRAYVGAAPVIPALVYVAVERVGPGRIVHHTGNRVVVPEGREGAAFAQLLKKGGIAVVEDADFTTAVWRKLLSNVAANAITALTMRRIGVMREPAIEGLARVLLEEAAAVGRAIGAHTTDQDVADMLQLYKTYNETGGTSMLYDRLAGAPLEHDHLTGAVVRTADRVGVPVPVNRAIFVLLDALDKGVAAHRAVS